MISLFGWFGEVHHFFASWWPIARDYWVAAALILLLLWLAWIAPGPKSKLLALLCACCVIATTIAYTVGEIRGSSRVKADWDWELGQEHVNGEKLRSDAVGSVRAEPDSVRAQSPWNRDTWQKPKDH